MYETPALKDIAIASALSVQRTLIYFNDIAVLSGERRRFKQRTLMCREL